MKITKQQLRKLIRETLDTTWPGRSRKFSRPDRKLVREMGRETLTIPDLQLMAQDVVSGASDDYDADEELLPWEDESHGLDLEYLAQDSYAIRQALESAGWDDDEIGYFLELDHGQRLQLLRDAAGEA
jgi:hypothetical protein